MTKNINKPDKEILRNLLETIICSEKSLIELKVVINEMVKGKIDATNLREFCLAQRLEILRDVYEIFPFYYKQLRDKELIRQTTDKDVTIVGLEDEIDEKNEFIGELDTRIDNILKKLVAKVS